MIMKLFKTTLVALLACLISLPCTAAKHDEDPFQLFIDFLKQEMLYHKDAVYYPFPFKDIPSNSKDIRIESNPERIKQLIANGISYRESTSSAEYNSTLTMPHRIKIQALNQDRYRAEAFVTLPDSSATLNLNLTNIGIPQSFDKQEVTLMRMEGNVAYLLIEDKSELIDYSYTRPDYIFPENEEEEDEKAWKKRELASPYIRETDIYRQGCIHNLSSYADDGYQYITRARITGVAHNAQGQKLDIETLSEDFRHYLWYRNMDMPYSTMEDDYEALRKRFPTPKGDNHHYQLCVVRLEASGQIANLSVNILSRSTQPPLQLQLEGEFKPRNYYSEQPSLNEMTRRISTIKNLHPDSIASQLTVTPYVKSPRSRKLGIIAFLPACYNTQYGEADVRFTRLTFPYEADSITLELNNIETEYFDADYLYKSVYGDALTLAKIPFPSRIDGTLTGEVQYHYPIFEAARYDLPDLPEGLRYENDTLFFDKKEIPNEEDTCDTPFYSPSNYYLSPGSVTAYDEAGQMLPYNEEYGAHAYKMIFERPVKALIKLEKEDYLRGKIPFRIMLHTLKSE